MGNKQSHNISGKKGAKMSTQPAPAAKAHHHEWGYDDNETCGPRTWHLKYKDAAGQRQSPIDIITATAVYDANLEKNPLKITYDSESCGPLKNTGHAFQIDAVPNNKSRVSGGPLKNTYSFLQFHMHWGQRSDKGSEHLVNGQSYAAELHFVNWNSELYGEAKQAATSNNHDGLTVLGVFVQIGEFNEEFEKFCKDFQNIKLKNKQIPADSINLKRLLPENTKDYWTYKGSLTTPPCSESVQWIVFSQPIKISREQLKKCQSLHQATLESDCNALTCIAQNYRPVCPMGDRILSKSFNK